MIIFYFLSSSLSLERMNEQDGSESLTVQRWTSRIAKMAQPDLDFIGKSCASLLIHFPMTIKVSRLKRWTHIASLLPRTDGFVERIITDQYIWFYFFFFNFLRKCCMKTSALATHKRLDILCASIHRLMAVSDSILGFDSPQHRKFKHNRLSVLPATCSLSAWWWRLFSTGVGLWSKPITAILIIASRWKWYTGFTSSTIYCLSID